MTDPEARFADGAEFPLAQALADGDGKSASRLLPVAPVALALAGPGANPPVTVLVDDAGNRLLPVFSSPAAVRRWDDTARLRIVEGAELPRIATEQGAAAVIFDVSGPAPFRLETRALQAVIDGIDENTYVSDELRVRPAGAEAASVSDAIRRTTIGPGATVLVFERAGGRGFVLTVGVTGEAAVGRAVADAVRAAVPAGSYADVIALDKSTRDAVLEQIPEAFVAGTDPRAGHGRTDST